MQIYRNASGVDIPAKMWRNSTLDQRFGIRMMFETARMYHGRPPVVDINHVFGVTTFELG